MKQLQDRNLIIRYAISLLAITLMVAVAEIVNEKEIIFPELVALTVGLWIIDKRVWRVRSWQIICSMTLAAVIGVCIVRYVHLPHFVNMSLAFAAAVSILLLFRSTLIPLISACMLPVLLHTEEWVYPVSVFAMTSILVVVQAIMVKFNIRHKTTYIPASPIGRNDILKWVSLFLIVVFICALAQFCNLPYLIIPPLIVTFVEFATSGAGFRNRPAQVLFLLVFGVCAGTVLQLTGVHYLHLSQTLVAFITGMCILLLFLLTGRHFAPAGAMAFVPMIVPPETLTALPLQATLGAVLFISLAMVGFIKCYKWNRAQLVYSFMPTFLRKYMHKK